MCTVDIFYCLVQKSVTCHCHKFIFTAQLRHPRHLCSVVQLSFFKQSSRQVSFLYQKRYSLLPPKFQENIRYWISGWISIWYFPSQHIEQWGPRELCASTIPWGFGSDCVYLQLFILPLHSYLNVSQSFGSSEQHCEIKDYCPLSQVEQWEPKFAKAFSTWYAWSETHMERWKEEKVTNFQCFYGSNAILGLSSFYYRMVGLPVAYAA